MISRRLYPALTTLALGVMTAAEIYRFRHWDFDDAFIVFRIVRNLIGGHGWTFNIGEIHNASTSVLNTVAIALASRAIGNIQLAAHLLHGLWIFFAALMFAAILRDRFSAWVGLAAGISVVCVLAERPTWGLETPLFVCLLALVVRREYRGKNPWYVLGLLALTRPDGLLVAGIRWVRTFVASRRFSLTGLLQFTLVLSPWLIYAFLHFHRLMPDTLANKRWQGQSGYWGTGHIYLQSWIAHTFIASPYLSTIFALAVPGLYFVVRDRHPLTWLAVFVFVQQVLYVVVNVPGYHWYFVPFDAAMVVVAFYGIGSMALHMKSRGFPGPASRLNVDTSLFAASAAIAVVIAVVAVSNPARDDRNNSYQAVARHLTSTGVSESLAAAEVGTLGYFLEDERIVDLLGLASANPEFVTGKNNDIFYSILPKNVLFHVPLWPTEIAIHADLRLEALYGPPSPVLDPNAPMELWQRKPDARPLSQADLSAYLRLHYASFQIESRPALVNAVPSADASCILDTAQGQLANGHDVQALRYQLFAVDGWAIDHGDVRDQASVEVVLTSGRNRYTLSAPRIARPDVAAALHNPRAEMAGYQARGSIIDLPSGTYRLGLAQARDGSFTYCEFANRVTILDAIPAR